MIDINCTTDGCACNRIKATNRWSKDFIAGELEGRKNEAERTTEALVQLRDAGILEQHQVESVLDLILEKLIDVKDID